MKTYNNLQKSILLLQKEQLVILSKEISNLFMIVNYHLDFHTKVSHKGHFKTLLQSLKKRLQKLSEGIKTNHMILTYVIQKPEREKEKKDNFPPKAHYPSDEVEIVLFIELNRERIDYFLGLLKSIYERLQQMINNSFYYNSFRPVISKRYSNSNIVPVYELFFQKRMDELIKPLDENFNKHVTFTWEFKDSYEVDDGDTYINFTMSYWNFDIPIIANTVFTHELGHLMISDKYFNLKKLRRVSSFKRKLLSTLSKVNEKEYESTYETDEIVDEFLADLVGLFYHGTSYLLGLFHMGFAGGIIFVDQKDVKNYDIGYTPSKWGLRYFERDRVVLRIAWLVVICELFEKKYGKKFLHSLPYGKDKTINIIVEIKKNINLIYPLFSEVKNEQNFYKIYEFFENIQYEYNADLEYVGRLFLSGKKLILKEIEKIYEQDFSDYAKEKAKQPHKNTDLDKFPFFANDLWRSWFRANAENKIAQKIFYRTKIHKETICELIAKSFDDLQDKDIRKKILLTPSNLKPYKMSLIKGNYSPVVAKTKRERTVLKALGFYDNFFLEELDALYESLFKELREDQKSIRSNHSLMQIIKPVVNKYEKKSGISCVMQIDIEKADELYKENNNIYKDLLGSIYEIYEIVVKAKKFQRFRMFKTLGPSDLVLFLEDTTIDTIYAIKKALKETNNNSLTTILYNKEEDVVLENENCFFQTSIVGKLSSNGVSKVQAVADVDFTTGIYDFDIIWKTKKLSDLISCLNDENIIEQNTFIKWSCKSDNDPKSEKKETL